MKTKTITKKGEQMKNTKLKKDIMKIAEQACATEFTIVCGTLFAKFNVSIHEEMANTLKTTLQAFFDKRKVNDCHVQMSGTLPDNEYAYDFMPIVDYRMEGII